VAEDEDEAEDVAEVVEEEVGDTAVEGDMVVPGPTATEVEEEAEDTLPGGRAFRDSLLTAFLRCARFPHHAPIDYTSRPAIYPAF
jgi:hypothetical protein